MLGKRLGYAVKETAKALGCNDKTVYSAIKNGEIRALRIGGRIIIPAPVLDRLLTEGNIKPPAESAA